jgi:hypothetical protein
MARYKFVGDGMGVPGLPHEISDEDAEALGMTQLLSDAIANGSYAAAEESLEEEMVQAPAEEQEEPGEAASDLPWESEESNKDLTPNPSPTGEGNKRKRKE